MATTTNYGWVTPDDTALVKDGAAAIRTLGSSADTTTKNLNPETTLGDLSFRSSTANVNTRIGIGTAGQNLTVVAGVPAWANPAVGGMTLLSTTTLSGATTTISGIDQTYKDLQVYIFGATNATADGQFRVAVNGSTTSARFFAREGNTSSVFADRDGMAGGFLALTGGTTNLFRTSVTNFAKIIFPNYADVTHIKNATWTGFFDTPTISFIINGISRFGTTAAITSLVISNSGGNLSTGTVEIYGVK